MSLLAASPIWAGHVAAEHSVPSDAAGQSLPFEPQEAEDSDPEANLPYLFAVYIITWAGFFAFVFVMSRRQREMGREIEGLKATLAERDPKDGGQGSGPGA